MVQFMQKEEITPVCPFCKREITAVWFSALKGDLGKRSLYFCPHCRSVLGVSHRKGLTFGW